MAADVLDLDALEREAGTTGHVNVERPTWDALIQRLREAEAACEAARADASDWQKAYEDDIRLDQAVTRIAQLERVREAAIVHVATDPVRDMAPFIVSRTNLRAALAAAEEQS